MSSIQERLSIFNKFNFEMNPVGIKFLLNRPNGIEKLDKSLAFCEMFKEAQDSRPFYATKENFACVGKRIMGMEDFDPIFESGQIGYKDGIFKEARANRRIYQYIPKLAKGSVNYVAFSPLDKLTFEPDLLTITANVSQAEILLRAHSYTTGKILSTKSTPAVICAWLFFYPYTSGELNFSVTGLGFGMKSRKMLPEGLMLISIPYDLLPMMAENLKDMEWVLPLYTVSKEERSKYTKKIMEDLRREYQDSKIE